MLHNIVASFLEMYYNICNLISSKGVQKKNMEYITIPQVNKPVSKFLFGTTIPSMINGSDSSMLLDLVYQEGITTFDCARNYGLAEKSLGDWIEKREIRDKVVLLTKCAHPDRSGSRVNEECIRKDFAQSSEYLKTSYIDIYLLHRDDPTVPVGEIVELLNAMHAEGKIGAFGGSNWTYQRIMEANEYAYKHSLIPFTASSPHFSLAHQVRDPWGNGCLSITGKEKEAARNWYRSNQMPVLCYSSLAMGLFSGKLQASDIKNADKVLNPTAMNGYGCPENFERLKRCELLAQQKNYSVSQLALAWIFHQKLNALAIVSTSKIERVRENIKALSVTLSETECSYLNLETE